LAVLLAAILIKRSLSPSHILATSMLLILIYDPVSILSAGFWLSFSAVAIILFITQGRYPAPKYYWLKIHIVLAFSLSPLLFLFFQKASLIAPIANIIAVPFISLIIVPLVLFATCFLFYFPDISRLLFELADMLIHYFWLVMSWFAHFPFSEISITSLAWYYWIVVIIGITLLISPRGFPVKWLGLIGLLPLLYVKTDRPDTHEFWLTLLDVGQGLSAIIQTQNHTLIFDAGAKFGQDSDSGMSVVLPFLNHQGITHIDTFIVSHGDNDHRGGAQSILDNISVNTLLTSAPEHFLHASHCYSGMAWSWDDVDFELLHPRPSDPLSGNNSSCVLKVSTGDYSLLLTGDIEAQAEQLLIHRYPTQLSSTLLIAPHHGSNTSSTNAFIKAVNPEFVLFPVGFSNRFGFPSKKVVDRYISHKIPTMNTAESGAIQMNVNQDGYAKPTGWRQQHQKVGSYMTNPTE
jgi:competence protein ComEC